MELFYLILARSCDQLARLLNNTQHLLPIRTSAAYTIWRATHFTCRCTLSAIFLCADRNHVRASRSTDHVRLINDSLVFSCNALLIGLNRLFHVFALS